MSSKKILVGVSGGIAAYKALDVVSSLRKQQHQVQVVMTEAATRFVHPRTFAAVSGQPVLHDMWPEHAKNLEDGYPHLYPATETDLFVLVPATANTIAKIAGGFGSDLLSTSCLSLPGKCRKIFCPSMNVEMWLNRTVQANAEKLEQDGWRVVGPESGHLACGMTGEGRLSSTERILQVISDELGATLPLQGKRLLILSGPTREHLDPVRFIGNPSSGLMGQALAEEAARLGAAVEFVTGPVPDDHLPRNASINIHPIKGALEMLETGRRLLPSIQAAIYVAAVSDYRPEKTLNQKMPKHEEAFDLKLVPNPDISATLNREKNPGTYTIGFALQTENGESLATEKLKAKGLDGIVLNYPDSMGSASGTFSFLSAETTCFESWGAINKKNAARKILSKIPKPE
ncbi:bifunctional phosphopantothenoylcysteine decarboxylase/phosphopantothenate--cysteine ligase CoaBC [Kiritimatiellaeota bacterium B1221]|nr:bifunctional phosphopantothenoylcysteine decarboxylase/phosphopantothenate--cysteine ligase CoaBC [Kiritimatiellaeota bacterium B1221]